MRRFIVLGLVVLLSLFGAGKALAGAGIFHYVLLSTSTSTSTGSPLTANSATQGSAFSSLTNTSNTSNGSANGQLNASFQEVALGNIQSATYTLTSSSELGEVGCVTNGGNIPSAVNKSGPFSGTSSPQTFTADKNGSVKGSVSLPADISALLAGLSCGTGQTPSLISVTFCSATLLDITNADTFTAQGPFVWINPFLNLKTRGAPVASCT